MWEIATLLVLMAGLTSGYITCPDGHRCQDGSTCCQNKAATAYNCCPITNAVCCADKVHCCPRGTFCNAHTLQCDKFGQPWGAAVPMLQKVPAEEPAGPLGLPPAAAGLQAAGSEEEEEEDRRLAVPATSRADVDGEESGETRGGVVPCDRSNFCTDGYSCCISKRGGWWCCPYSPSMCCLDGAHCCPYGFNCDVTFKACLRQGLRYPFTPKLAASFPAFRVSGAGDGVQRED